MRATRRTFLSSLGAAILGGRLLDTRPAFAQSAHAKRLVVFFSPDGTEHARWRPVRSGDRFRFAEGSILEPLAPVQSHLTVIDGLEYSTAKEHQPGMMQMLTNHSWEPARSSVTAGASLDQYVAGQLGRAQRFSSLELGVQCSVSGAIPEARMCFSGTGRSVPPNEDPRDVYRRLFADVTADAARLLAKRRSVLDLVREETSELAGRLGGEERLKLEAHLEALRETERGLEQGPRCESAPSILQLDPFANDNFGAIGRAQMDLMVAALACNLTRVSSIQWSHAASETVFNWLGHSNGHHSLSHAEAPGHVEQFIEAERWYSEQFRYLVERLAALPEPGESGSLLDHSIILWVTEIGDRVTHFCQDLPIVIAGGGSGRLRPGRYLTYGGESHGKLLTSLCWAMGLQNPSFGDESFGTGGLEGLLA